jgi:hypothetical protein
MVTSFFLIGLGIASFAFGCAVMRWRDEWLIIHATEKSRFWMQRCEDLEAVHVHLHRRLDRAYHRNAKGQIVKGAPQ